MVTRPAEQAGPLAAAIGRAGGNAVLFPVLAIHECSDPQRLVGIAARLEEFDLAVFVSPNAVKQALSRILAQRPWPTRVRVATVGKSSERELTRFGIADVIAPQERFDSEALLELPELREMAGKRIVVFRGDGGRELLGDTLVRRGAKVEYVACYRRDKPDLDATPLLQLWESHQLDAVIVTSSEGLRNLCDLVGKSGQTVLANTPLFLPHVRIVEQARLLGLQRMVPTPPGDEGILAGLIEYFSSTALGQRKVARLP
ncbi:MAG: uroporphyrinogen-III synthase [Sterolibacterium sp.]|nr:uroporphyrinogen-III synthase [Sterolibacterium sp.]